MDRPTEEQIQAFYYMAKSKRDELEGAAYPGDNVEYAFANGVVSTLDWILGESDDPFADAPDAPHKTVEGTGATGAFPAGRVRADDEGELKVAVGTENGLVVVDFGKKPIKWVGMEPAQAIEFAKTILGRAQGLALRVQ